MGASLTALMVMVAVPLALLNAVVPPLVVVLAVWPFTPEAWSQARKVKVAEPLKLALGTKRMRFEALSARRRETLPEGLPKAVQLTPPSVENCHAPFVFTT